MSHSKRLADSSHFLVSPKFLKLDEELRKGLENVHGELTTLDKECREDQIEVRCKYQSMKNKHFDARADVLRKIPYFWKDVLEKLNSGSRHRLILKEELELLDYLENVNLEDHLDRKGSYKFTLTFKENPFFKETTIVKSVKVKDWDDVEVTCTPITFTKNPLENVPEPENSFLGWLQSKDEDEHAFGDMFREHVWEEAVKMYKSNEEEDDDETDEDDDEEYDGEHEGEGNEDEGNEGEGNEDEGNEDEGNEDEGNEEKEV